MTGPRHKRMDEATRRDAGFSLLEIMVALVILALAMGLVGVAFGRSSIGVRFEAAAQDLALNLREAQARALRSGRDVAVAIDVEARTFSLQREPAVQMPENMGIRVVSAGQVMEAGNPVFTFMPDGGSSGGSITLSLDNRETTINVDWLTGAITTVDGGADAPQG